MDDDLCFKPALEVRDLLRSKSLGAVELLQACLAQISSIGIW